MTTLNLKTILHHVRAHAFVCLFVVQGNVFYFFNRARARYQLGSRTRTRVNMTLTPSRVESIPFQIKLNTQAARRCSSCCCKFFTISNQRPRIIPVYLLRIQTNFTFFIQTDSLISNVLRAATGGLK